VPLLKTPDPLVISGFEKVLGAAGEGSQFKKALAVGWV
jgi:hypothetical protein